MASTLRTPVAVATCIACGARSGEGACPDGCDDVPLDLVELADVERMQACVDAWRSRVDALSDVVQQLASERADSGIGRLAERARAALRAAAPPPPEPPATVEAWGCPACGRIDAPQPCLGVCVRQPVLMVDAARLGELAAEQVTLQAAEAPLARVARLAAAVRPRPGHEAATQAALRDEARRALAA